MKIILIISIFFINQYYSQNVFDGYTLFTPQQGNPNSGAETRLMDNDETIIHSWSHDRGPASMPYLIPGDEAGLENCILVYPYRVPNPTMDSGGVGGGVQFVDWNGNILWDFVLSNQQYQHHHDVEPIPDGEGGYNILMVAWEAFSSAEAYAMGRVPGSIDNPLNQMWSTAILEVEPYTNNIVWEWHLWDHMVQERAASYGATFGNVEDHPELMNINEGNVGSGTGPGSSNADWIHINAIDYNENLDQIAISSRFMSEIYIIDHSTTTEEAATHEGGNSGKGGDFLYRWGNPQIYNRGTNNDQILDDQHSVNWIPDGYPGEGNFLIYNNIHQTNPNRSAVLEFENIADENGFYTIGENEPFGPETYSWIYLADFFSPTQSGAYRLPNGNTLITVTMEYNFFEVDNTGRVQWDPSFNSQCARALKYGYDYFEDSIKGDINGDQGLNILDIILMINYILQNQYNIDIDMNQDSEINILDIIELINLIL